MMPAEPNEDSSRRGLERRAIASAWRNIGLIATGVVLVYCVVRAFDPPRLNWGDPNTDYNVMIAGRNFATHGFLNLRLTPNLLDRSVMTSADSDMVYTHYPQLADVMNGALRTVFGMTDFVQFRFVALALSFGAMWFVYRLISTYWSRQTGQIAIALWVTNPLWIQHADYLHHRPYGAFFGFGSVYFLTRSFSGGHRGAHFFTAGVFLFLTYLSSYNYWIFTPLLLAAVTVGQCRGVLSKPVVRTLGTLAVFAVLAILCKIATNIWALNGVAAFLRDLRYQYLLRATNSVAVTNYRPGIWPVFEGRVERFFTLSLFAVALFWAVFPLIKRRWGGTSSALRQVAVNPIVLLVAALPFLLIFTEMLVHQYYPMLLLLPFYAIGCAAIITLLEAGAPLLRFVGRAYFAALLATSLFETASFKLAFFDEQAIRSLRAQLDARLPVGRHVLVNYGLDAAYRYHFDRRIADPLINRPPFRIEAAIAYFSEPGQSPFNDPNGAILVQHKHLTDEMFDKGYGWILARSGLWDALANPPRYHRFIDSLIVERDSAITAEATRHGDRLYENDFFVLWRIRLAVPRPAPRPPALQNPSDERTGPRPRPHLH
jgi:hypothetical protein